MTRNEGAAGRTLATEVSMVLLLGWLVGCSQVDIGLVEPGIGVAPDPDETFEPQLGVALMTRDGVPLEADVFPGQAGRPAVVLLHMTPVGGWNRTNWPEPLIERLRAEGLGVVALDRRGAGGSAGVAEEAFIGDKGRYDVEAAVKSLEDSGFEGLYVVGASNGTTSMIDYAVWAPSEGLPGVAAMVFMTGGAYTENQTSMSDVPTVPSLFTYSTAERDWSAGYEGRAAATHREYPEGDHGTLLFDAVPSSITDVGNFLLEVSR